MLHEPEFESPESADATESAKTPSRAGRAVRGVFYIAALTMFGVAIGVQASPRFAETVGKNVPEPVAAAFASLTGGQAELPACNDGKCCSSMNRASLMTASVEEGSCCSSGSGCAHEAASLASAEAGSCCSTSTDAGMAAGECSGQCPLSLAAAEEELAISLAAPKADVETETVSAEEAVVEDVEVNDDAI